MRTTIVAIGLSLLVACADGSATSTPPGATPGGISPHRTGADELVLSMGTEGGYVPTEFLYTNAPDGFALYGDGTIVVPGAQATLPGRGPPATVRAHGLRGGHPGDPPRGDRRRPDGGRGPLRPRQRVAYYADAGTAVLTLTVDGETHRVTAYALGLDEERYDGQPEQVWEARRALSRFEAALGDLNGWLPEGSLGDANPFEADAARLLRSVPRRR